MPSCPPPEVIVPREERAGNGKTSIEGLPGPRPDAGVQSGRRGVEFDEPLTPEEAKASETAWQAYLAGLDKGEPLEKVRQELLEEERG
jgi:hypothetical protein